MIGSHSSIFRSIALFAALGLTAFARSAEAGSITYDFVEAGTDKVGATMESSPNGRRATTTSQSRWKRSTGRIGASDSRLTLPR